MIVDAHCDTITKIMEVRENLFENHCHVDIQRMRKSGSFVQFFAAFIEPAYGQAYAMKRAVQIFDEFFKQVESYQDSIMLCCNYNEIKKALSTGHIAAVLSLEGGDALQGDLSALRVFYRLGVRSICLTWNHRNEIADGVADASTGGGLTTFGRKVVKEMNTLGMLVDVSHIAEKGFWDVIEHTSQPIIASHSNAKKICNHRRNLTDEQILALKKNGGVMGLNLCPAFLNDSGKAGMTDILRHIEYIISLIGDEHVGLGADFDGIAQTPEDISGVQDLEKIFNELLKLNYMEETLDRIAGKNFLRVIKNVLR